MCGVFFSTEGGAEDIRNRYTLKLRFSVKTCVYRVVANLPLVVTAFEVAESSERERQRRRNAHAALRFQERPDKVKRKQIADEGT